jgi:hypothetical protein
MVGDRQRPCERRIPGIERASSTIRLFAWADEAVFVGQHDGLDAVTQTQFREHAGHVRLDGLDAHEQWEDKQPVFRPIRHAWRVEVAHGRLGRSRRLAKSFENTTTSATGWLQVACIATTLRHLSQAHARRRVLPAAA